MTNKVLGVLSGQDFPVSRTAAWAARAECLYAADSAADVLLAVGFKPTVVGDLDSVRADLESLGLRVVRDPDPNRTDCDKLLDLVLADGHTSVTLAGLEGDLPDHVLATYSSCVRTSLAVRAVFRRGMGYFLKRGADMTVPGCFGRRVSLLPLQRCSGVSLSGVFWPLTNEVIELGHRLSVSNEGTGDVTVSIEAGAAILFIERNEDEALAW